MAEAQYLHFEGLDKSVALENAAPLRAMLSDVLSAWPHQITATAPESPPFVSIKPDGTHHWSLVVHDGESDPRRWDAVNAICDLVAEIAWERLRSDPDLLCLHAAAADFGGRLVVFPNARRAGKSTLATALARRGHPLYTDDFLPIRIAPDTQHILGIANGIAPRIRLPLPQGFSDGFRDWVDQDPGPDNAQYKYLLKAPIAPGGEALPLGAMVVLDRTDSPGAPTLVAMPRQEALASLITQNFARTLHAGIILKSIDAITQNLPVFRLTYHCGEDAAAFLSTHPDLAALPAAKMEHGTPDNRQAPLDQLGQTAPRFVASAQYVQAPGLTEAEAGGERFLADGTGLAIYRLNAGSTAIWRLLAEPTDLAEVVAVLAAAFPDTPQAQIATDSEHLMRSLAAARLITSAASDLAAQ